jgi:hypothetical protein
MNGPPFLGWLLMVLGFAAGVSCLLRAGAGGTATPDERRTARDEGLMGFGMGLMAVPASVLGQRPWESVVLALFFCAMGVRFLVLARDGLHRFHHAVEAAAMAYMAVAMGAGGGSRMGGMAGMAAMGGDAGGSPSIPVLTGVLLAYFALYALAAGIRLLPATGPEPATAAGPRTGSILQAPEIATACRLSLGIGMFIMLLTM